MHISMLPTLGGFENDSNCPATLPGSLWPHLTNPHDVFLLSALNAQDSLIRDFWKRSSAGPEPNYPISNDVLPPSGSAFILNLSCVLFTWGEEQKELCMGGCQEKPELLLSRNRKEQYCGAR